MNLVLEDIVVFTVFAFKCGKIAKLSTTTKRAVTDHLDTNKQDQYSVLMLT